MSVSTKRGSAGADRACADLPTPSELPVFAHALKLTCGVCGVATRRHVGRVMVAPEVLNRPPDAEIDSYVGFTRYIRCRKCDAGGPWKLDPLGHLRIIGALILRSAGDEAGGVFLGETRTFDGRRCRYPTDAEAHLKELLAREPERVFLWVRLGNLYLHAGRADLATPAFRRAVELAPDDPEVHCCLAEALRVRGRVRAAIPHWKAVLKHVRHATHLSREMRMDLVEAALGWLLDDLDDPNEAFESLAAEGREQIAQRPTDQPLVVRIQNWDLNNPTDWVAMCRQFLGEQASPHWQTSPADPVESTDGSRGWDSEPPALLQQAVPRNAPCPCGSGHKYKKCCGREWGARSLSFAGPPK